MKTKEFSFPQELSESNTEIFLRVLDAMRGEIKKVRLNFKNTLEITPAGVGMLLALLEVAIEQKVSIESVFIKNEFKHLPIFQVIKKFSHENYDQDVVKTFTSKEICYQRVDENNRLIDLGELQLNFPENENTIKTILDELIQNALDHSTSERFYYFVGTSEHELSLGVLDLGVSIPSKLEQKYDFENDIEYIESSLKKEISTRRLRAGGKGLAQAMELVKQLNGRIAILSRRGQLRHYFKNRRIDRKELKFNLPGTWTFINIPLHVNHIGGTPCN